MTEPPEDGVAPSLSRAQRRQLQSRSGRRQARQADGRLAEPELRGPPDPCADLDAAPVPTTEPERALETPVVWPPSIADSGVQEGAPLLPVNTPDVVVLASNELATDTPRSRRERRQTTRRKRRREASPRRAVVVKPVVVKPVDVTDPEVVIDLAAEAEAVVARPTNTRPPRAPRPSSAARVRFWKRTMPAIALVLMLTAGVGVVLRALGDEDTSNAAGPDRARVPEAETVLIVHHRPLFGNDFIALAGREGSRGSVLLIPGATQLDVPALGVGTLNEVPVEDNAARLANSVENVLGVKVSRTVLVDDAGLTAILGPAAPISITLSAAVDLLDHPVKYQVGAQAVSAAQASELLSGLQSVNELDRLVTASAVMSGWLDRLRDPAIGKRTLALQADLAPLVAAAAAPEHRLDTLAVDSISTGGGERFAVREADLADYAKRAFPAARLGTAGIRPRVEILNGTGALGVAQAVANQVVPAGGKVTLTENVPGFGVPTTQVVYYSDQWKSAAQRLLTGMGCGSLRKAGKEIGIADVTIVVGSDCPAYGRPGDGT